MGFERARLSAVPIRGRRGVRFSSEWNSHFVSTPNPSTAIDSCKRNVRKTVEGHGFSRAETTQ